MATRRSRFKLDLTVEYRGVIYRQPDCRIKTTPEGYVMMLIKNDEGKWEGVKGKLSINRFSLKKEFYVYSKGLRRTKIPSWILKLFRIKI